MEVEEILTIYKKNPGWKKGTRIAFLEKCNEQPNVTLADLIFIIEGKPHSMLIHNGNDLIHHEHYKSSGSLHLATQSIPWPLTGGTWRSSSTLWSIQITRRWLQCKTKDLAKKGWPEYRVDFGAESWDQENLRWWLPRAVTRSVQPHWKASVGKISIISL